MIPSFYLISMNNIKIYFYECEHYGDLDNYIIDIKKCNGKVIHYSVDYDNEIGLVVIEHDNLTMFLDEFKKTEAYQFSNLNI